MLTNLLFFLLTLLLIGLAPELVRNEVPQNLNTIFYGLIAYALLLCLIVLQNRLLPKKLKKHLKTLVPIELLTFLCFYFFSFHIDQVINRYFPSYFLTTFLPLLLYFGGLLLFFATNQSKSSFVHAFRQIKQVIPFALPIFFFAFFTDIIDSLNPALLETPWFLTTTLVFFLLLVGLFIPPLICYLWECKPLHKSYQERLDLLCKKAAFSHAGFKTWHGLAATPTAAILGLFPAFRYILFTPALLNTLSPEALEAVLAHEIGHNKHKHLLWFPLILLGMILFTTLLMQLLFTFHNFQNPFLLFFLYAVFTALYFRFIFGYFSRLFERQADLHGMRLGIPLKAMQQALNTIGIITGNSHRLPSWHHFSLQERIAFLQEVEEKPILARWHHQKVRFANGLLLFFVTFCLLLLYFTY